MNSLLFFFGHLEATKKYMSSSSNVDICFLNAGAPNLLHFSAVAFASYSMVFLWEKKWCGVWRQEGYGLCPFSALFLGFALFQCSFLSADF